jgi:hypothetical protein
MSRRPVSRHIFQAYIRLSIAADRGVIPALVSSALVVQSLDKMIPELRGDVEEAACSVVLQQRQASGHVIYFAASIHSSNFRRPESPSLATSRLLKANWQGRNQLMQIYPHAQQHIIIVPQATANSTLTHTRHCRLGTYGQSSKGSSLSD